MEEETAAKTSAAASVAVPEGYETESSHPPQNVESWHPVQTKPEQTRSEQQFIDRITRVFDLKKSPPVFSGKEEDWEEFKVRFIMMMNTAGVHKLMKAVESTSEEEFKKKRAHLRNTKHSPQFFTPS